MNECEGQKCPASLGGGAVADDFVETLGFEGRTADEGTVDVRAGHQLGGVVGLHAAAVLDADLGGGVGAVEFGDDGADEGVRVLRLLGGGGDAGADGPDGFVGDDGFTEILFGNALKAAGDLGAEDAFEVAGLALGEGLADAEDRL